MCHAAVYIAVQVIAMALSAYSSYSQQQAQNEYATAQTEAQNAYAQQQAELQSQQQEAENRALEMQRLQAEQNALAAEKEGRYATQASQDEAALHREKVRALLGQQRAAAGASGAVVDQGTFLDLGLDTVHSGKLDELAILHEGDKEAWRAKIQAQNYRSQGSVYGMSQSTVKPVAYQAPKPPTPSPLMAAAPQLMSGIGKMGMNYYNMS